MRTLIITEKSSQARDLRAALGDRFGRILPAEGHLLRLAEPEDVDPRWKRWSCALLKPDGLYPTRPDSHGGKPAKLAAIAAALTACDQVILATDCDREGQLIGQEILEHLGYRGPVQRALFTAQDPKTLRQAFASLKPNESMQPLFQAAVARQQADQIFNLSLTRTATRTLLAPGARGVIGIGRVKTPTLAIVCLREREILAFRPEDYFEVAATATVAGGTFRMRHAPALKHRLRDRSRAEAIARAADGHHGPLTVVVEDRRQAPPRLFDLPALQKTCGQRWGWTAERTLSVAQALYDGQGKTLITYPRAEARYLAETQAADVPTIVGALARLRGFAHLDLSVPVIRRGRSGTFCDAALAGVAHHAIIPNVNVMDDLEPRLARLSDDEKRLFALLCRAYLAAMMPDFEYRQTTATRAVPVPPEMPQAPEAPQAPGGAGSRAPVTAEFRAVGRIPVRLGWKAVFGSAEADPPPGARSTVGEAGNDGGDGGEAGVDQTLPPLVDGEPAGLSDPQVEAKRTQPPPRYSEGTLVDAMQNAWRFVTDPAQRERLKDAKGIGTPATRAEIIKGLKRQNLLAAQGRMVVPTPAGLQVFDVLRAAAPALVDPGTTAVWEMRLDQVATGRADFRTVIDAIADDAGRLIGVLQAGGGAGVDPGQPPPAATKGRRRRPAGRPGAAETAVDGDSDGGTAAAARSRRPRRPAAGKAKRSSRADPAGTDPAGTDPAGTDPAGADQGLFAASPRPPSRARGRRGKPSLSSPPGDAPAVRPPAMDGPGAGTLPPADAAREGGVRRRGRSAPTDRMLAFARDLAQRDGLVLPAEVEHDFDACRRFLDQHAR